MKLFNFMRLVFIFFSFYSQSLMASESSSGGASRAESSMSVSIPSVLDKFLLKEGVKVVTKDLNAESYNGLVGVLTGEETIKEGEDFSRFSVELEKKISGTKKILKIKRKNFEILLQEGSLVRLKDLKAKEYNGKLVDILKYQPERGRYEVAFLEDKEKKISFAPKNLDLNFILNPFYYRAYVDGQPTESYFLGTTHIVPFEALPERVRTSIFSILENPKSSAISETGYNSYKEMEDPRRPFEIFLSLLKEYPSFKVDLSEELEIDRKSWEVYFRGADHDEETQARLIQGSLEKIKEQFKTSWIRSDGLENLRKLIKLQGGGEILESGEAKEEKGPQKIEKTLSQMKPYVVLKLYQARQKQEESKIGPSTQHFGMDSALGFLFSSHKKEVFALDSEKIRFEAKLRLILKSLEKDIAEKGITYSFNSVVSLLDDVAKGILEFYDESPEAQKRRDELFQKQESLAKISLSERMSKAQITGLYSDLVSSGFSEDVDHRNETWVPVLEGNIKKSSEEQIPQLTFVGCGHFPGERGLINLLEKKGIELRRITPEGSFVKEEKSSYAP